MLKVFSVIFGIVAGVAVLLSVAWAAIIKADLEEEREAEEIYQRWNMED